MLTSFVHSITDDEGNAWQTPQSDDQDPQVRSQYIRDVFFPRVYDKEELLIRVVLSIDSARVSGHPDDLPSQIPDLRAVQVRLCRRCRLLGNRTRSLLMVEGYFWDTVIFRLERGGYFGHDHWHLVIFSGHKVAQQ